MKMVLRRTLLAFGAVVFSTTCYAITANGSFGFNSTGGVVTYTPGAGLMINATSITIPVPNATTNCGVGTNVCEQITSIPNLYLGAQNSFAAGGPTPLSVNDDITFNNGFTFSLNFSVLPVFMFPNSNRFSFTATSGSKQTFSIGNSDFLNVAYLGTFHDSNAQYVDAPASLSLTFTQTGGATGTVVYSGTFATPPAGVPEPETMALVGCALVGVGLVGRKKLARR